MIPSVQTRLTEREANSNAIEQLKAVPWASPLLGEIRKRGGLNSPTSFLFELRFAIEIHRADLSATYEYQSGVGLTSVDFCIKHQPDWLVELVSPEPHSRSDEESQMLKFAGVLNDKVCTKNGRPAKFPAPLPGRYHVVIVDVRDYLYGMGDALDWSQIAYGPAGIRGPHDWALHWTPDEVAEHPSPIRGVFDPESPVESAKLFRERVHFIGFINEQSYSQGEMRTRKVASYLPNPSLFKSREEALEAFRKYPLKPLDLTL